MSGRVHGRLALLLAVVVGALWLTPGLSAGYSRLCTETVDAFPTLAAARTAARAEAEAPPRPVTSEPGAGKAPVEPSLLDRPRMAFAALRATALDAFLQVKQSNQVAFPLHALTGYALEAGRCESSSIGDQWRKAAAHAWEERTARLAADGLRRTLEPTAGGQGVRDSLRRYAVEEPWHAENLRRVEGLLADGRRAE